MIPVCRSCGTNHSGKGGRGAPNWIEAETARLSTETLLDRNEFNLAPYLEPTRTGRQYRLDVWERYAPNKFSDRLYQLEIDWHEYMPWILDQAEQPRDKDTNALCVTNPSSSWRTRQEPNFDGMDRLYFDCDKYDTWHRLADVLDQFGVHAIFQESSSSVKRYPEIDQSWSPTSWHVEIPLAYRFTLQQTTSANRFKISEEWGHEIKELKRAYRHLVGVFSALAGFNGVGTWGERGENKAICGLDISTDQLCIPRFVATRAVEGGRLPLMFELQGNQALNFNAFLEGTGFKWKPMPERLPPRKVVYVTPSGEKRERVLVASTTQLYHDVKDRVTVRAYMEYLGRSPTLKNVSGGDYYFCPIHHEENNPSGLKNGPNRQGFHVFDGRHGFECWDCFGDCKSGGTEFNAGDVIHLAAAVNGVGRHAAAVLLAQAFGMDLNKYRTKAQANTEAEVDAEVDAESAVDDAPESELEESPAPLPENMYLPEQRVDAERLAFQSHEPWRPVSTRPRRKQVAQVRERLADWIEDRLLPLSDAPKHARAMASIMMRPSSLIIREPGQPFQPGEDPERIAATIDTVLYESYEPLQALGDVVEACDNLAKDKPEPGRRKLLDAIGPRAMHELAGALWRDAWEEAKHAFIPPKEKPSYKDAVRTCLGFDRLRGIGRKFMDFLTRKVKKLEPILPEHATDAQRAEYKQDYDQWKSLVTQLQRPFACGRFMQKRRTQKRDLSSSFVPCGSKSCTGCTMVEAMDVWEIVLPKWRAAMAGQPVYVLEIEVDTLEQAADARLAMRHADRARLSVIGFRNGKPVLAFVCLQAVDISMLTGRLGAWYWGSMNKRGFEGLKNLPGPVQYKIETAEEILGIVTERVVSYHVELAQRIWEQDETKVLEFLRWSYRRQVVVTRSSKALPWATKEEIKAYRKAQREDKDDLEDDEKVVYDMYHVNTGILLMTQDHPFTIDQCIRAALAHPSLRRQNDEIVRAEWEAEQRRKRKRTDSRWADYTAAG